MRNFWISAFAFTFVNVVVVMCMAAAVTALGRNEYPTAVVAVGMGLAFTGIEAAVVLVFRGKVKARATVADGETTIRPDVGVDRLLTWATVAGVVAVAVYAIFSSQGKIDLPLPYGHQRAWTIAAIGLTLTGIANLWSLYKRGGNSFVRLDPRNFEMGQGVSSIRGEWDDVVDIADRRPGRSAPVRATLFVKFSDGKIRTQAIDSYTRRGTAMRRLVRYYWQNPDKRDELADGRAVQRLTEYQA